ncbi:MAG: hypothetical protein R3E95_06770 [Thiolinea sp.]
MLAYVLPGSNTRLTSAHGPVWPRGADCRHRRFYGPHGWEVFQSSGQQDMKARTIAESSAEFKALVNNPAPTVNTGTGFSHSIAAARQTLARCEEKLKAGKEKHCNGDKAKLDSLLSLESQQTAQQTQIAIATNQTQLAFKRSG